MIIFKNLINYKYIFCIKTSNKLNLFIRDFRKQGVIDQH